MGDSLENEQAEKCIEIALKAMDAKDWPKVSNPDHLIARLRLKGCLKKV